MPVRLPLVTERPCGLPTEDIVTDPLPETLMPVMVHRIVSVSSVCRKHLSIVTVAVPVLVIVPVRPLLPTLSPYPEVTPMTEHWTIPSSVL